LHYVEREVPGHGHPRRARPSPQRGYSPMPAARPACRPPGPRRATAPAVARTTQASARAAV